MAKSPSDPSKFASQPTVGITSATQFTNASGRPGKNMKSRPKKLAGGKGMLDSATATHRSNIQEPMGARLHPTVTLYAANAASANETKRNVKIMPSVAGQSRNFWGAR